jgi:uncharacterized protein (TIGR02271 family)
MIFNLYSNMNNETNSRQEEKDQQPSQHQNSFTLPVVEETVHVEKKTTETGKVKISKTVKVDTETVNLLQVQDEVQIERIAINEFVQTPPPPVRYEGDIIIIPVLQEVMVTEKRLLLIEEVRITKRKVESKESQEVALRKEEIKVERS